MALLRSGPEGESSNVARIVDQASTSAAETQMVANDALNYSWSVFIFL